MMKIIGICGGSGSGKTTLVEAVRAHLSTDFVSVISQDSYYKNHDTLTFEERCELNYDHPNAIDYDLFVSHLNQLKAGKSIHSPIYSYSEHLRSDQFIEVFPKPVVLVEGILIFAHTPLKEHVDIFPTPSIPSHPSGFVNLGMMESTTTSKSHVFRFLKKVFKE